MLKLIILFNYFDAVFDASVLYNELCVVFFDEVPNR